MPEPYPQVYLNIPVPAHLSKVTNDEFEDV
jgi:hypothetical protein